MNECTPTGASHKCLIHVHLHFSWLADGHKFFHIATFRNIFHHFSPFSMVELDSLVLAVWSECFVEAPSSRIFSILSNFSRAVAICDFHFFWYFSIAHCYTAVAINRISLTLRHFHQIAEENIIFTPDNFFESNIFSRPETFRTRRKLIRSTQQFVV